MISLVCICGLFFASGVLSESTHSSNYGPDSTTSEPSFNPTFDYVKYSSLIDEDLKSFSPDIYPLFKKVVKELASSEQGMLILWDTLNGPEPPRAYYEQVFRAYDRMVDEVSTSTTTEEDNETTLYNLDSTEPDYSESATRVLSRKERVDETREAAFYHPSDASVGDMVDETTVYNLDSTEAGHTVSGVLSRKERVDETNEAAFYPSSDLSEGDVVVETTLYNLDTTEPENSELVLSRKERVDETKEAPFLQPSTSSEGDVVNVYYSENNPEVEVVVLDGSYYTSSSAPDEQSSTDLDTDDIFKEVETEDADSNVFEPEVRVEDNVRRSGILLEKRPSKEADEPSIPLRVGSIRGIPCKDFPCYDEIPITSFSCADKRVPGIYADLETGCQVFHVCWPNRRESFLCPIGTTFNQPITACDYWYSSNCSLSSLYLETTTEPHTKVTKPGCKTITCKHRPTESSPTEQPATTKQPEADLPDGHPLLDKDWFRASKFVPVKTKVTIYFKPEHHSSKKTAQKTTIKQKHDIMPLIEEFIDMTKVVAKDSLKLVPEAAKSKVFKRPATKLLPCLEIKDRHHKPTPSVTEEPKPLPTLNPRFIVKPVEVKKPLVEVSYEKKNKIVSPKVVGKHQSLRDHKASNSGKDHASEIVLKALEMAGEVFQRDVLAIARQAMAVDHKHKP